MTFIRGSKHRILWGTVLFSVLFIMIFHMYYDLSATAWQGKRLWDYLFEGRILKFYFDNNYVEGIYDAIVGYPITMYIIFAVWELPIWILEKILKTDVYSTVFGMLYTKGILVLFYFLCIKKFHEFFKLAGFEDEEADKYTLMAAGSACIFYSMSTIVQYDIITVYFVLCAMCAWIKEDRKMFLIHTAMAVTLKYFALLYFAPLILIWEKNILKLMRDTLICVLPSVVLYFYPKPSQDSSLMLNYLRYFFAIKRTILGVPVPFFVVACLLGCIYSYFFKTETKEKKLKNASVATFIFMGSFMIIVTGHPYWNVMTIPAFIFFIAMSDRFKNLFLAGETFIGAVVSLRSYYIYYWLFNVGLVARMKILPALLGVDAAPFADIEADYGIGRFLREMNFGSINSLLLYVMFGLLILMVLAGIYDRKVNYSKKIPAGLIYSRTILNILIGFIPLISSLAVLLSAK